jgi:hypothetical protein
MTARRRPHRLVAEIGLRTETKMAGSSMGGHDVVRGAASQRFGRRTGRRSTRQSPASFAEVVDYVGELAVSLDSGRGCPPIDLDGTARCPSGSSSAWSAGRCHCRSRPTGARPWRSSSTETRSAAASAGILGECAPAASGTGRARPRLQIRRRRGPRHRRGHRGGAVARRGPLQTEGVGIDVLGARAHECVARPDGDRPSPSRRPCVRARARGRHVGDRVRPRATRAPGRRGGHPARLPL